MAGLIINKFKNPVSRKKNPISWSKNPVFQSKYWVSRQLKNQVYRPNLKNWVFQPKKQFFCWETQFFAKKNPRVFGNNPNFSIEKPSFLSRNLVSQSKNPVFGRKTEFIEGETRFFSKRPSFSTLKVENWVFRSKKHSVCVKKLGFRQKKNGFFDQETGFLSNRKTTFINQIWKTGVFFDQKTQFFVEKPVFFSLFWR